MTDASPPAARPSSGGPFHGPVDWFFRSRQTGRITIAQFPNPPLWVFLGAWVVGRVAPADGAVEDVAAVVATGALVVWALDELVRGVNPWRRLLGAGALVWQATRLL